MEPADVFELSVFLHDLYGDRFPPLSDGMARLWYAELRRWPMDLADQAIRRWARQHTRDIPSLDQLLEQIEFVQEEARRTRRPSPRDRSLAEILEEQLARQGRAEERSEADASFGTLMIALLKRTADSWQDRTGAWHDKLTLEGRATQCYEWATERQTTDPELAERLRYQARAYAQMYHQEQEAP